MDINWLPIYIETTIERHPSKQVPARRHNPRDAYISVSLGESLGLAKYASNLSRKRNNPIEYERTNSLRASINQESSRQSGRRYIRYR